MKSAEANLNLDKINMVCDMSEVQKTSMMSMFNTDELKN